jgi:hypothetical protein
MDIIQQQLHSEKQTKQDHIKDIYYVDDCNNCLDTEIRGTYGKTYTPCTHPWYCHHKEPVRTLEFRIGLIQHNVQQRGYWCSHEAKEIKKLGKEKWKLIQRNRKEWLMSK